MRCTTLRAKSCELRRGNGREVHRVQRACHAGEGRGNDEGEQLVVRDRDTDGVGRDLVVADRHDCAAGAAVDKVQHEEQGHEDENDARGERRDLGNALGAIVNSSRGIIAAYKQEKYTSFGELNYADASRQAVKDMIEDISGALNNR